MPILTYEELFNKEDFKERLRLYQKHHGPILEDNVKEPETKSETKPAKEMRVFTVKDLYRMPIGHSGDIPRHCATCKEPPTQFAVVYSKSLRLCYHFCNDCFTAYLHKPLDPRDDEDATKRRQSDKREIQESSTSSRCDDGRITELGRPEGLHPDIPDRSNPTDGRNAKPVPYRTSESTSGDSGAQRQDDGVEASGILAAVEVISSGAELLFSVISEI